MEGILDISSENHPFVTPLDGFDSNPDSSTVKPLNFILSGRKTSSTVDSSILTASIHLDAHDIEKRTVTDELRESTDLSKSIDFGKKTVAPDFHKRKNSAFIMKAAESDSVNSALQLFEEAISTDVATLGDFMAVIRCCSRTGSWALALRLLDVVSAANSCVVVADAAAHNAVLDVLLNCGEIEKANELVSQMNSKGLLDTVTFNTLLKGVAVDVEGLEKCEELFGVMKECGIQADAVSYNCVVNAAVRLDQLHTAWNWVGRMRKAGIEPDKVSCATLVKVLTPTTPRDILQKTLNLLDSLDVCADTVLFSTVVDACARLRDTARLQAALDRFSKCHLQPNAHAYGAIIKALSRCGKGAQAWDVWSDMERRCVPASSFAVGCLLDALPAEQLDLGLKEFRKQRSLGVEASIVQFGILIRGCVRSKRMDDALQLYHEMRDSNVQCNVVVYNTLIDGFCSSDETSKAVALLENMIADGAQAAAKADELSRAAADGTVSNASVAAAAAVASSLIPDVITYSSLIKGLCREGDVQGALALLNQMQERGVKPDTVLFNTLLDGMAQQGDIDGAEELLEQMLDGPDFCRPSAFTLTIMVRILGRANRPDRALQLYKELPVRCNFPLDPFCHTAAMATAFAHSRVVEGLGVLNEMISSGMRPSSRTFASALTGVLRHGGQDHLVDAAYIAITSLKTPGGAVDVQHVTRLLQVVDHASEEILAAVTERIEADGLEKLRKYASGDSSVATSTQVEASAVFTVTSGQRARFNNGRQQQQFNNNNSYQQKDHMNNDRPGSRYQHRENNFNKKGSFNGTTGNTTTDRGFPNNGRQFYNNNNGNNGNQTFDRREQRPRTNYGGKDNNNFNNRQFNNNNNGNKYNAGGNSRKNYNNNDSNYNDNFQRNEYGGVKFQNKNKRPFTSPAEISRPNAAVIESTNTDKTVVIEAQNIQFEQSTPSRMMPVVSQQVVHTPSLMVSPSRPSFATLSHQIENSNTHHHHMHHNQQMIQHECVSVNITSPEMPISPIYQQSHHHHHQHQQDQNDVLLMARSLQVSPCQSPGHPVMNSAGAGTAPHSPLFNNQQHHAPYIHSNHSNNHFNNNNHHMHQNQNHYNNHYSHHQHHFDALSVPPMSPIPMSPHYSHELVSHRRPCSARGTRPAFNTLLGVSPPSSNFYPSMNNDASSHQHHLHHGNRQDHQQHLDNDVLSMHMGSDETNSKINQPTYAPIPHPLFSNN